MTSHSGTVEDERLRSFIEYADEVGCNGAPAISSGDLASMARELLALRSTPHPALPSTGEAGELVPFAWHWWAVGNSQTWPVTVEGSEKPAQAPDDAIALYPASSLTSLQARVEELERENRTLRYDWGNFCRLMGVNVDTHEAVAEELSSTIKGEA